MTEHRGKGIWTAHPKSDLTQGLRVFSCKNDGGGIPTFNVSLCWDEAEVINLQWYQMVYVWGYNCEVSGLRMKNNWTFQLLLLTSTLISKKPTECLFEIVSFEMKNVSKEIQMYNLRCNFSYPLKFCKCLNYLINVLSGFLGRTNFIKELLLLVDFMGRLGPIWWSWCIFFAEGHKG